MLARLLQNPEFWKHLSIPFVAALIGWVTNWCAIKMTFHPLRFVGPGPWLGWQGIIPSKAGKMAAIFVDRTMSKLGTLEEMFRSMDPDEIARHISEVMDQRLDDYTDEILFYQHPAVWKMLPEATRRAVHAKVRQEMPRLVRGLMEDVANRIDELVDFKDMLVRRLEGDRRLLNRLFLEAGSVEFRFIIRSGLYFGFLFGLIQLAVWIFYKSWWVLPAFGILVGYATNWFAINIIFRPLEPHRVGPWTLQGVFLKRQHEVAAVWCRLVTTEIVTLQHIIYEMMYGPQADRARELIRKHIQPVVDDVVRAYGPLSELAVSEKALERIKESVGRKAVKVSTDPFDHWPFNRDRAVIVEQMLRERMETMPPAEFQDLLRPCFQEDEMKLILTGAALGFLAGVAQLVFVFGGV